jgi:hypothetical protein
VIRLCGKFHDNSIQKQAEIRTTQTSRNQTEKSITQSREAAKKTQRFSLRCLCGSASLRESFCFGGIIQSIMPREGGGSNKAALPTVRSQQVALPDPVQN